MKKKLSLKNIYLLSVIGIGLIGLALGSTYAMFITNVEIDNPISLSTNLSSENDIIETVEVTVPANNHIEVPLTINNQSGSTLNYSTFYVSSSSDIEVGTKLSNSDSSIPTGTISSNTTKKVYVQIKNNTSSSLTITLGVSSSINNIVLSSSMTIVPNTELTFYPLLSEYITNLYTSATKTEVTSNSINYNYATSVGLMNDRLGGTTTSLDGGNIRYYGASPNNYIYFNCSDYSNQSDTTCEKWRIIGVFDGKVKLIRDSSIGVFSWDNKDTTTGAESNYGKNDWTTARLMKLLNPSNYYTVDSNDNSNGQSLYWNSGSGKCFAYKGNSKKSCDFTSTGIKNETTRKLIAEVTYNIGGWYNNSSVYPNAIYEKERGTIVYSGRPTTWPGKIALMYPSDYGYAADLSLCKDAYKNALTIYQYNTNINNYQCRTNNYLYKGTEWLMTHSSLNSYNTWAINLGSAQEAYVSNMYATRPVLFLLSDLTIENDSDGTSSNPYKLSLN